MGLVRAGAGLVGRLRDAADRGEGAVDQPHHLADEDLAGRLCEAVAAEFSPLARHDPRLLERLQDLLQELDRQLLAFRQFRDLHELAPHLRGDPEVDERAQRVLPFFGQLHAGIP